MVPNKQKILEQLVAHFRQELRLYERVSEQARLDAISGEVKQEGKYDTRAIEAGYLAGAQRRRYEELVLELQRLEALDLRRPSSEERIQAGAVIQLGSDGRTEWFFLSPTTGGLELRVDGAQVRVVSIRSPLGQKLISWDDEEELMVALPSGVKRYSVLVVA